MLSRLLRQESGSAAAEMALVTPLLIVLMLGSMELGYYFYSEHVVVKAVRDGARFASRQSFADYTCSPDAVSTTVRDETRRVTRTNQVATGGTPRLGGWTSDASVTVTVNCYNNSGGTYITLYEDAGGGLPRVTVSATVPYTSLFSTIGFPSLGRNLNASSQAVVMGV